jgi:protein-L-isoaspartate(D-aspartate) O-methyltransferase
MNCSSGDRARQRARMIDTQTARGVRNARVLEAMRAVPRQAFVPRGSGRVSYEDGSLPIGEGQMISQPYIMALMAGLADPGPEDKVLDVGTGSG